MLIHAWNIQAGGGTRIGRVLDVIAAHGADTVVLGETTATRLDELRRGLEQLGLGTVHAPPLPGAARGVLIASKHPFGVMPPSARRRVPAHRWCEAWFPRQKLRLAGIYFPDTAKPIAAFWPRVHEAARRMRDESYLIVGDLNSGQSVLDTEGAVLGSDPLFSAMPFLGMFDLWRHTNRGLREYTWFSNHKGKRRGFRLDHAFGTQPVRRRLRRAWYSSAERVERVSDHSSLLVEIR